VGSEDIDSGEVSQSDDAEQSDADSAGPSGDQDAAQAAEDSDDGADEVGDLSWEAVMAAVQGGGSGDEADEEEEAAAQAGSAAADDIEALPQSRPQLKARKSSDSKRARKQGAVPSQRKSQLGKRPRQK